MRHVLPPFTFPASYRPEAPMLRPHGRRFRTNQPCPSLYLTFPNQNPLRRVRPDLRSLSIYESMMRGIVCSGHVDLKRDRVCSHSSVGCASCTTVIFAGIGLIFLVLPHSVLHSHPFICLDQKTTWARTIPSRRTIVCQRIPFWPSTSC